MTASEGRVEFSAAPNTTAFSYEIHVNFIYFEVDKKTNQVVKIGKVGKNITPRVGEKMDVDGSGSFFKKFPFTFYEDIAAQLERNDNVVRYIGRPGGTGSCIEVEGWAAGESLLNFLLSNQPTQSFVQINTIYTNVNVTVPVPGGNLAFGFLSSRVKSPATMLRISTKSEQELIGGPVTGHLGFKPWTEYKP